MKSTNLFQIIIAFSVSAFILVINNGHSFAQDATSSTQSVSTKPKPTKAQITLRRVNSGKLGIISGGISGTYLQIATDLATVLDRDSRPRMRLLPIAGKGGVRNLEDLIYMQGVDLAIVQSDILKYVNDRKLIPYSRSRLQYIAKLYDSELHILAKKNIKSIKDLDGKTVNLWHKGSSTDITSRNLFRAFNIQPIIVYMDSKLGIQKTINGDISATILITGKPAKSFTKLPDNSGLHLLPIDYNQELQQHYLPSKLTSDDYPNLIASGASVSTLSSSALLVTYKTPRDGWRYKKVTRFVDAFFSKLNEFRKEPRHPKWKETSIIATVPNWKRFTYSEQWIEKNLNAPKAVATSRPVFTGVENTPTQRTSYTGNEFNDFLVSTGVADKNLQSMTAEQQEVLFRQFTEWKKRFGSNQ